MEKKILLLGDPRLYEMCQEVEREELPAMAQVVQDLKDTKEAFRRTYGFGRSIAAPQIGVNKRLIYVDVGTPVVLINPEITVPNEEKIEVMDDCMSFPYLLVRLQRHRRCVVNYRDLEWNPCTWELEGELSALIQHEYDHLNGILATMRAENPRDFVWRE